MIGGNIHEIALDRIDHVLESLGIARSRNVATRPGRNTGYVDLVAYGNGWRLAIEFEMSARRIANDLQKAADLNAALWIAVPNLKIRNSVRRQLGRCGVQENYPWIAVLTQGQCTSMLTNCFPFFSMS